MKKKRPAPKRIEGGSFGDMIADARRRSAEADEYVKKTGLCGACKKNPVADGQRRCQPCLDKGRARFIFALKQLR